MTYHCLFEQSGTFKNEFKKLGYNAYDYDILNDFGETDYQINIFNEIEKAYDNKESIFDKMCGRSDFLIAFFPCVRFEEQILLFFRGESNVQRKWSLEQKLEYELKIHEELHNFYKTITKLVLVCIKRNLPLIIENPYGSQHYLQRYWCIKPTLIDKDRTKNGDYYVKPTQYWFINCEPKDNFIFEPLEFVRTQKIQYVKSCNGISNQKMRSMIHPQYANRFIRQYIIDKDTENCT